MVDERIWKARQGDRTALEEIVREFYPRVLALALRMLSDPEDAHDATQETFARVLRSLHHYREKKKFRAWVFTIASNVVRDIYRPRKKQITFSEGIEEALAGGDEPDRLIDRKENEERVKNAFDRLPGNEKLLLLKVFQQGMSRDELSQTLGISVNAVRIRLHRALELLRRCVQEQPSREIP